MKPLNLIISGWGPFSDKVTIDFTKFGQGSLFLITGPTGAGKTTIFDAITYALYGEVSGKTRDKGSVRSDFAGKDTDTYVSLKFTHKDTEYLIKRSPKYTRQKKRAAGFTTTSEEAELYCDDKETVTSPLKVNREVEELLGINYKQFKQIAMIAQGEFLELLISNSKDRVGILRNIFKTERYDKMQKLLTERSNHLHAAITELNHKMDEAVNGIKLEETKTYLESLEELGVTAEEDSYTLDFSQLQELIKTVPHHYSKIVELLNKCQNEDIHQRRQFTEKIKNLEEEIRTAVIHITNKDTLNQRIVERNDLIREAVELERNKKGIIKREESINAAIRAEKVKGNEDIYINATESFAAVQKKYQELLQLEADLQPKYNKVNIKWSQIPEKEVLIEKYREEELALNRDLQILDEISELEGQLKKWKESLILCESTKEMYNEIRSQRISELDTIKKELLTLDRVEIVIQGISHELKENSQKISELQNIQNKNSRLSSDRKKWKDSQKEYELADADYQRMKGEYDRKEKQYKDAVVGVLAKGLMNAMPCPVCGSTEHPNPAKISAHVPDETELEESRILLEEQEQKRNTAAEVSVGWRGRIESQEEEEQNAFAQWAAGSIDEIVKLMRTVEDTIIDLNKEEKDANEAIRHKKKLLTRLEECEAEIRENNNLLDNSSKEHVLLVSQGDKLKGSLSQLKSKMPDNQRDYIKLKSKSNELKCLIESEKEEIQNIRTTFDELKANMITLQTRMSSCEEEEKSAKAQCTDAEKQLFDMLIVEGFDSLDGYRQSLLPANVKETYEEEINKYYERCRQIREQLQLLNRQIGENEWVDTNPLALENQERMNKKDHLTAKKENLLARIEHNETVLDSLNLKQLKKDELEAEYGIVKDLDNTAKGNNKQRLVFEQYVLSAYFEDILHMANQRLVKMTNSRYELLKVDKVMDARTRDSLDLEVFDNYTGKRRTAKSLSGGESFKAALSLALGLSDIIQSNAGGIEIETLFIDEGFGSLDTESLDQALNTLTSLTEREHMIGIISHVNELKERVDQQIIVESGRVGSRIKQDY